MQMVLVLAMPATIAPVFPMMNKQMMIRSNMATSGTLLTTMIWLMIQ